jgi:hypothetical protein
MTAEANFIHWLLPDAEAAGANWTSNPQLDTLDPAVQQLFADVECQTGVPRDWLAKAAGLVVDGLAGLQCLWFLHGASGTIDDHRGDDTQVDYGGAVGWLGQEWMDAIRAEQDRREQKVLARDFDAISLRLVPQWSRGLLREELYFGDERPPRIRVQKLGRFIHKVKGLRAEHREKLLHYFETRELKTWNWKISADPLDVLTMSFRRPWTSCMRPPDPERDKEAGEAQYGPLTDMAAGSAILFFYRPGATTPAGRMVLRPAIDAYHNPVVLWPGGRMYGSGPTGIGPEDLEEMLRPWLEAPVGEGVGQGDIEVAAYELCALGRGGNALSRLIYSDVDNTFCQQDEAAYEDAYGNLGTAEWPAPALEASEMRSVAVAWAYRLSHEVIFEGEFEYDMEELVDIAWGEIKAGRTPRQLWALWHDEDGISEAVAHEVAQLADMSEDIVTDVTAGVEDLISPHVNQKVAQSPTFLISIESPTDPNAMYIRGLATDLQGALHALVDDKGSWAVLAAGVPQTEAEGDRVRMALDELGVPADERSNPNLWLIATSAAMWKEGEGYADVIENNLDRMTTLPAGQWDWGQSLWREFQQ